MRRVLERDGVAAVVAAVMELRFEKLKLAAHGPTRARRASFTALTFVCAHINTRSHPTASTTTTGAFPTCSSHHGSL
jgi:hypothetical protein